MRLLIIEDDPELAKLMKSDFRLEGFEVEHATDGVQGLEQIKRLKPDLVILDVMLPKMSGYDVCRVLRKEGNAVPILMLSAKGREAEKVVGLDLGADDYLAKPFGSLELMARVKALLRRHSREISAKPFKAGTLTVDFQRMEATRHGTPIEMSHKEFQVFELLVRNRGQVVSRRQFLEEVWGYDAFPTTRAVDNTILSLRKKLQDSNEGELIVTVHGVGYKLVF